MIRTPPDLVAVHQEKAALLLTLLRFAQELIEPRAFGITAAKLGHAMSLSRDRA